MKWPTDRLARATAAATLGLAFAAAGLGLLSLTTQQSRVPVVLGRYSLPYAAMLAAAGLALAGLGAAASRRPRRLAEALAGWLPRLPADAVYITVLAASAGVSWLFFYPPYGVLATPWFRAGELALLLAGAGCLALRWLGIGLEAQALAAGWSVAASALGASLLGWSGASLDVVRFAAAIGLPGVYGLTRGAAAMWARRPRLRREVDMGRGRWLMAGIAAALGPFVFFIYSGARQHGLVNNDEIFWINHIFVHEGAASIFEPATTVFARPFFQVQAWLDYRLFGLDHAGYVLVQLGLVWLSAVVLFAAAAKISGSLLVSGLLAALVVAHRFVADLVTEWAIDTVTLNAALAVGAIYWLAYRPESRSYYAVIGLLLLVGCLSRENGLVTAGAVGLSAVLRLRQAGPERARAGRDLAVTAGVLVVYFLARRWWLGAPVPPQLFFQETCLGSNLILGKDLGALPAFQRGAVTAYTALANLAAPVAPFIFNGVGCLPVGGWGTWLLPLAIVAGGAGLCQAAEGRLQRMADRAPAGLSLALLAGIAAGGPLLLGSAPALMALGQSGRLDLWLHGALTLLVLYSLARERPTGRAEWMVAANVIGAWLGGALVFALYFRYRNLYTLLFGWALLMALGWQGLRRSARGQRYFQATVALLLAAGVAVSATQTTQRLPVTGLLRANLNAQSLVCWPVTDSGFAEAWGRWHSAEEEVAACRARERCNPATWQLPYTDGRERWAPAPGDGCDTVGAQP